MRQCVAFSHVVVVAVIIIVVVPDILPHVTVSLSAQPLDVFVIIVAVTP